MATKEHLTFTEIKELLQISEQFLEELEAEEIVRSICEPGQERRYLPREAEKVRVARVLVNDMGVNLEGVEVILRMRETMFDMRAQMDRILECILADIKKEFVEK
ncbi:MAG: hypothetical protein HY788_09260 [Deltaproteobacteria bacterium]|nr:hypothetical protein [Deltaproteobacteria bacterium]